MLENYKIEKAETKIIGHIHEISIRLWFRDCCIIINPKRNWFSNDGKRMPFYDLFDCFDIDCEDGASIESLTGKYCRLEFDCENKFDPKNKIVALWHITENKKVLIEDLH